MSEEKLIIAGAGAQGILFIGELISHAAGVIEDKHTTWFPDYGPTMRGGKANCTVIVSDEEIGSPITEQPDSLIAMNEPSLEMAPRVRPGGLIIVNESLVKQDLNRKDIEIIKIRANHIAEELGSPKVANVVMLGAFLKKREGLLKLKSVIQALKTKLSGKPRDLIKMNQQALIRGWKEIN